MIEYTTTWRCRVGASEPLNMVSVVDIKIPPTAGWRVVIYQNKPAIPYYSSEPPTTCIAQVVFLCERTIKWR